MTGLLKSIGTHPWAKIASLGLAALVWLFVVNDGFRVAVMEERVPIQFLNLPENLAVTTDTRDVQVRLRAPVADWESLKAQDFTALVDLGGTSVGERIVSVRVLADNPEIRVLQVLPSEISVFIEPVISREVPVRAEISGSPGEDYGVGEVQLSTDTVRVFGAQSVVRKISEALVVLELRGEEADIKTFVPVAAREQSGSILEGVSFDPAEIEIRVPLLKETITKSVSIRVATVGNPAVGFWVSALKSLPAIVTIRGEQERIGSIDSVVTSPVNISNRSSTISTTADIQLPEGVILVDGPIRPEVTVSIQALETTKSLTVPVRTRNAAEETTVTVVPTQVTVTVSGAPDKLQSITAADVNVSVDLSGKDAGSHQFTLGGNNVTLPADVALGSISPDKVTVIVEE